LLVSSCTNVWFFNFCSLRNNFLLSFAFIECTKKLFFFFFFHNSEIQRSHDKNNDDENYKKKIIVRVCILWWKKKCVYSDAANKHKHCILSSYRCVLVLFLFFVSFISHADHFRCLFISLPVTCDYLFVPFIIIIRDWRFFSQNSE